MTPDRPPNERIETLYAAAIRLYPPHLRDEYGAAMRQALRDALADGGMPRSAILRLISIDFTTSVVREHLVMLRDTFTRPALAFNSLVLAGIATVLALFLYAIPQQVLRLGADDPQIQLATDMAARLEEGIAAAEALPALHVDMARSLAPFVIVYDDQGRPLVSQAQLNGATPAPPAGVFEYVRRHGEDRISWQPVPGRLRGVRIAAVVERVEHMGSGGGGFVLAGRSLARVEARTEIVEQLAGVAWIAMIGLILAGTVVFGWFTRKAA